MVGGMLLVAGVVGLATCFMLEDATPGRVSVAIVGLSSILLVVVGGVVLTLILTLA